MSATKNYDFDAEMRDEVDFIRTNNTSNYDKTSVTFHESCNNGNMPKIDDNQEQNERTNNTSVAAHKEQKVDNKSKKNQKSSNATTEHKKNSTKERLSLFSFSRKLSQKNQQNGANNVVNNNNNNNNNKVQVVVNGQLAKEKPATAMTSNAMKTTSSLSYACQTPPTVPIGTPPRQHKFVKSSSISRLFGNTYNAKKFEKEEQKRIANIGKFHTYGGRRRGYGPYLERFKRASKEDGDVSAAAPTESACSSSNTGTLTRKKRRNSGSCSELATLEPYEEPQNIDLGAKALRTLSRGLGKLWWKRTHSVDISTPDPEFKVAYLGNVLTGWAKGEGCVEKQLATLWRNYTQNSKPDVIMRIKVCASGLKATTRQHGLTEYWANRITHCCAPKNYPRVFCWIYRHEGRKLKHELRCHAVLCSKEKVVHEICETLKENLECALREFKREKLLKQNARLSLANAAYDNPSLPRRKILLSVGGNNYRPPLERSKSAPKLMAIEEAIGEEGEEIEETNEPEMQPCCQRDSLYPAMTLGRRRCRRGHSIRRTGKTRPAAMLAGIELQHSHSCCHESILKHEGVIEREVCVVATQDEEQRNSYGSNDSDDFEKLLKHNNYDSQASLATELLPYFDLQLHKNKSSSLSSLHELKGEVDDDEGEPLSLLPTINSDPMAHPNADYNLERDQVADVLATVDNDDDDNDIVVGLRRRGVCSDGEEDDYLDAEDDELRYFRQQTILNILHRNSIRKMAQLSLSSDENSSLETNNTHNMPQYRHQLQSSISSNASSTATTEGSSSVVSGGLIDGHESNQQRSKRFQGDSDEGSISSGCETASTVTTPNQDDLSLQYQRHMNQQGHNNNNQHQLLSDAASNDVAAGVTVEEIYQRLEARLHGRHNSDATTFSSSSSITLKMGNSPSASLHDLNGDNGLLDTNTTTTTMTHKLTTGHVARAVRRLRRASAQREQCESDSEGSDESGYVEYQERDKRSNMKQEQRYKSVATIAVDAGVKPQPPPKPMPRRHINCNATTAV